jgi:hypothetical protein
MAALLALPFAMNWIFNPVGASADIGITLDGAAALSHMRGDVGGAFFAVGILLAAGLYRKEPSYLEAVSLIMVCIVAGRAIGVVLDGTDPAVFVAMTVETVTAAAAFSVARQLRSDDSPAAS